MFRLCAIGGVMSGLAIAASLVVAEGVPPLVFALAATAALAACFAVVVVRAATGSADLVWHEHEAAAVAAVFAVGSFGPHRAALLDAAAVGLLAILAVGRLGCLGAGCCHGRPRPGGIRYGERHVAEGFPVAFVGVPLAPVQRWESAAAAGLVGLGSCLMLLGADAGTAAVSLLAGRAVVRAYLERWRGDRGRGGGAWTVPRRWALGSVLVLVAAAVAAGA